MIQSKYFYIISIAIVLRIILSEKMGVWFLSSQMYDDALLMSYARVNTHFLNPNIYSLVKTIGYPLFINVVYICQLNYPIALSLVWIFAACLTAYFFFLISQKKWLSCFAFLYVLFMPMAFEGWLGTRMYRNSIIAPFVIIVFSFCFIILYRVYFGKYKRLIVDLIACGIFFSFTYYIKEDGLWLLACLMLVVIFCVIKLLIKSIRCHFKEKKNVRIMAALLIPILIFACTTVAYKSINKHFFGVYAIETRNGGEIGKFVANVYKIESENRNSIVWAPADAIEKAFDASPTLKMHPELIDDVMHTDWFNHDIVNTPIHGDFLTWVLRTSLQKTNLWQSEEQVDSMFASVNSELDAAFKKGTLKKSDRIQLLSSAGGRTISEMIELIPLMIEGYKGAILLKGYVPGSELGDTNSTDLCDIASQKTHLSYLSSSEFNTHVPNVTSNVIANGIFKLYSIINTLLCVIMFFVLLFYLVLIIRNWKNHGIYRIILFQFFSIIILLCISFAYVFSISWFSEFLFVDGINMIILNFYCVALPPILMYAYLFTVSLGSKYVGVLVGKHRAGLS